MWFNSMIREEPYPGLNCRGTIQRWCGPSHWSPAAYWAHRSGEFIFQHSIFLPFLIIMGFSRQESWSGLPIHTPVVKVLSELSTMTCLSWVALHGMAHSFIELDKAVVHVIRLISFLWLWFLVFPPFGWEGPSYPQFYLHSHSSQVTNSPCIFGLPSRQSSRSFLALSLHIPFVFFNQKHFLSRLKQYR